MIKKILILSFVISATAHAQEFAAKIRPLEFSWQLYACNFNSKGDSYSSFQKLLPNSNILSNSGYVSEGNYMMRGTSSSTALSFTIGVPIKIFNNSKFNNILRFGYDGMGQLEFGAGNYDIQTKRIDSTYYPQYNTSLMKDSVYINQSGAVITGNVHQIKTDLLFRFRPEKRFTLHSGIGIGVAITTNRNIVVSRSEGSYTEVSSFYSDSNSNTGENLHNTNGYSSYYPQYEGKEVERETYNLKTGYSLFSYLPFGIDWKIGKKENLLGKISIFTEGQIGVRISDVLLNTKQTTFYASAQLGLRVAL